MVALLLLSACEQDPSLTQVRVTIDAEPAVRAALEQLHLRVERDDREPVLDRTLGAPELPLELALVPAGGDATHGYTLSAEALDAQRAVIVTARLRSGFLPGRALYVRVLLEDACLHVDCKPVETCHDALCAPAEVDTALLGTSAHDIPELADLLDPPPAPHDGGHDPPVDTDAGADDAGAGMDAGGGDAGSPPPAPCTEEGAGECVEPVRECVGRTPEVPFCAGEAIRTCSASGRFEDDECMRHASCEPGTPPRCKCDHGFTAEDDACEDVDECRTDNGGCDRHAECLNEPGSVSCGGCEPYYVRDGDSGCAPMLAALDLRDSPSATPQSIDVGEGASTRIERALEIQSVELRPGLLPDTEATFDGTEVASMTWWTSPALVPGINPIELVVSQPGQPNFEHTLEVVRGSQDAYLKASNTDAGDLFGSSVAVSDDTIAVGAVQEASSATGPGGEQQSNDAAGSGAAYIFVRGLTWSQQAFLKASNTGAGDLFGRRVALDGDTLIVSAPMEDSDAPFAPPMGNENTTDSGAVYVFVRNGTAWMQQAVLKAANAGAGDRFGEALDLDGDTLIVGAPYEDSGAMGTSGEDDDESAPDAGAAYVFERSGASWTQVAYLKATNTDSGDLFGRGVAVSGDVFVVGATGEDGAATIVDGNEADDTASDAGAAYVFRRDGGSFAQAHYLKAANTDAGDGFGYRVVIDGPLLAVSAPYESSALPSDAHDDSAGAAGAVYTYLDQGTGFAAHNYLKAPVPVTGEQFGTGLALQGDRLLVGAPFDANPDGGFGIGDGELGLEQSGAVHVWDRGASDFTHFAYAKARDPDALDQFGYYVAIAHPWLVVAANLEGSDSRTIDEGEDDDSATSAGAVYVLR